MPSQNSHGQRLVELAQLTRRQRPVVIRPLCRGGSNSAWPSRAVLASLNRLLGDYDLAEEALHDDVATRAACSSRPFIVCESDRACALESWIPFPTLGKGRRFLVAPRGRTQWVRNAEAAGELVLKRGTERQTFRIRIVPDEKNPEILKACLDRFKFTVQRYFPVRAGSEPREFANMAERYPDFELLQQE